MFCISGSCISVFATASNPLKGLKCSKGENWMLLESMGVLPLTSNKSRFPLGSLKKDDKKKHLGRILASSQQGQANPCYGPAPSLIGNIPAAYFYKSCFSGSPILNLRGKGSQINENNFYFTVRLQVLYILFSLSRGTIKEREEQRKKHQEYSGT